MASPARRPRSIASPLAAALLLAGLPARGEELRISGTGSALGTMARVARAFEQASPGVQVRVLPSLGTSGAVKAVAAGALDVGLSGRALTAEEGALGVVGVEVARSPYVFAVGPRARVTRTSAEEIARIFRGEQTSWPGGERIRLVLRPATDADVLFLRRLSPALDAALGAALARPGMLLATTNQESDALVGRTPGALGLTTLAQLTTDPRGLTPLAWEGADPTLANLAAGTYPLWKPLILVLGTAPAPAARRLLRFLASPEGQRILEQAGNLPVSFQPGG